MKQDYIKHEYAKGVWYEVVRKCPRTARQRRLDAMYGQMMAQIQSLQQPHPQELANMYRDTSDWMRLRY